MHLGVDCSSRGVHAVLIDNGGRLVSTFKINVTNADFSQRITEIFDKFQTEISKINKEICYRKGNLHSKCESNYSNCFGCHCDTVSLP